MPQLDANATVGQWVAQFPQTARVLEAHHIDYCCGGGIALASACEKKQLDLKPLLEKLLQIAENNPDASQEGNQQDHWNDASLTVLCDHIEATHHAYLREEIPRLTQIINKVVRAHGANHPELAELQSTFHALQEELIPHMFKEEQILFPAIRLLEKAATTPAFPFGTVANPIRMMEHEHAAAGIALEKMRTLTKQYRVPEGACNTYRVMLDSLTRLEADTHQHIHKENNILFPKAQKLEQPSTPVEST